jgi:hypothetical protein
VHRAPPLLLLGRHGGDGGDQVLSVGDKVFEGGHFRDLEERKKEKGNTENKEKR